MEVRVLALRILAGYEPKNSKNDQLLDVLPDNFVNRPSFKNLNERWCINRITKQNVQKVLIFGSELASILKVLADRFASDRHTDPVGVSHANQSSSTLMPKLSLAYCILSGPTLSVYL